MYGGTPWEEKKDMAILNIDSKAWEDPLTGRSAAVISGGSSGNREMAAPPRAGHW